MVSPEIQRSGYQVATAKSIFASKRMLAAGVAHIPGLYNACGAGVSEVQSFCSSVAVFL